MSRVPREAGSSSFDLIDEQTFLDLLPVSGVDFILDFGCGIGNYLFAMAARYTDAGRLVGIDLWDEGIVTLNGKAQEQGLPQVRGVVEFKKVQTRRGPPLHIRLSENELAAMVMPFGFDEGKTTDLGASCYISTSRKRDKQAPEGK